MMPQHYFTQKTQLPFLPLLEETHMDSSKASPKAKAKAKGKGISQSALGDPPSPYYFYCSKARLPPGARKIKCCPPKTKRADIQDFKFPNREDLRIRPAAHGHLANPEYIAKFNKALRLMKDLPESDPRNFNQQAAVHCAYCVDSYRQDGHTDKFFQVHFSWLFLPFHRWYLYFFERILGKLIGDPTFAIPFWNWDSPKGMQMPSFYTVDQKNSPFYDTYRNTDHLPPTLVDLNFFPNDPSEKDRDTIIRNNLNVMYTQMVRATTPRLFLGEPYRAGDDPHKKTGDYSHDGAGSLEHVPHNTVHDWCGDPSQPNGEDMGHFYSAGFDPIFYGHHANVDRLWSVWKTIPGGKREDFTDTDWLDASFVFFDENCNPVRVYVKDCLDTGKLGYVYEDVPNLWLDKKPTPAKGAKTAVVAAKTKTIPHMVFPAKLNETVKAIVPRPKKLRSKEEKEKEEEPSKKKIKKEKEEEVLLIDGIEVEANVFVKFDVFINEEDVVTSGPHKTQWAGSFVSLRHTQKMKTSLKLGISELLEDLGAEAEDDENVLVTLVPKAGAGHVSIGAVKIEYL